MDQRKTPARICAFISEPPYECGVGTIPTEPIEGTGQESTARLVIATSACEEPQVAILCCEVRHPWHDGPQFFDEPKPRPYWEADWSWSPNVVDTPVVRGTIG